MPEAKPVLKSSFSGTGQISYLRLLPAQLDSSDQKLGARAPLNLSTRRPSLQRYLLGYEDCKKATSSGKDSEVNLTHLKYHRHNVTVSELTGCSGTRASAYRINAS